MATQETKTVFVGAKIEPTLHRALIARAKRDHMPQSQVHRAALRLYLKGQVTK